MTDDSPDSLGLDLWAIVKLDHDLGAALAEKEATTESDKDGNNAKPPAVTWMKENCYPSEPIFVPCPYGVDEGIVRLISDVDSNNIPTVARGVT